MSPGRFSAQASWSGKHRGQQVLGTHALEGRRHLAPAAVRRTASARVAFQRQRVSNMGAASSACVSRCLAPSSDCRYSNTTSPAERNAAGRARARWRLGGRGLQLEVELAAEALAQRQAPGAVDARAEGRVHHELHAARLVEEALEHELSCVGSAPSAARAGAQVFRQLRARPRHRARISLVSQDMRVLARREPPSSFRPQARDRAGELGGARRRLAEPEGDVGRLPLGVLHPHLAASPPQDPLGLVLPSWKMSPGMLSMAKSSLSVPIASPRARAITS